ncbi:hypothetical protein [Candidatus Deferrimicrobium sp.]|uniref:hypothetical protein n=1 Tax=Candidatus Deferrimicrobium sp. TaxID=3060586 RepID=UPI002721EFEA|nr:hypothetical protein [Candidatus Deferrimicrobium sp.]MDO8739420.1 hypothetical protein [Candidatus Deferrimicrobium sp.]
MRPGMDRKTYPTRTVEVVATTRAPITGFRFGGRRIEEGEQVRLPITDARHFERVGKCRILPDSEKVELL